MAKRPSYEIDNTQHTRPMPLAARADCVLKQQSGVDDAAKVVAWGKKMGDTLPPCATPYPSEATVHGLAMAKMIIELQTGT